MASKKLSRFLTEKVVMPTITKNTKPAKNQGDILVDDDVKNSEDAPVADKKFQDPKDKANPVRELKGGAKLREQFKKQYLNTMTLVNEEKVLTQIEFEHGKRLPKQLKESFKKEIRLHNKKVETSWNSQLKEGWFKNPFKKSSANAAQTVGQPTPQPEPPSKFDTSVAGMGEKMKNPGYSGQNSWTADDDMGEMHQEIKQLADPYNTEARMKIYAKYKPRKMSAMFGNELEMWQKKVNQIEGALGNK